MGLDVAELRGRIAVCMTAHELRELASRLGAPGVSSWDRGALDAARDLVRWFEREGRLGELIEALRQSRPLVEWPSVEELAMSTSAPSAPSAALAPSAPPLGTLGGPGALGGPGSLGGPGALGSSQANAAADATAEPRPPEPRPAPAPARAPAWPGTVQPHAKPRSTVIDPRLVIPAALLAVAAVAAAFAMGRASGGNQLATADGATGAPATAGSARARRVDGPSVRASEAFARGLAQLARVCELPQGSTEVLRAAWARCGPAPVPVRPVVPTPPEAPAPEPEPGNEPDGPIVPPPTPAGPAGPRSPGGPCVASCDARHAGCVSACGPEPQQSTKYADHQACLSKCLAASSKCRVGCR